MGPESLKASRQSVPARHRCNRGHVEDGGIHLMGSGKLESLTVLS